VSAIGTRARRGPVVERERRPDATVAVVLNVIGVVALLLAWVGASGLATFEKQIVFVNLGVGGVIVAAAGDVLYLLAYRRAVAERLRRRTGAVRPGGGL
jgi:hypothetical protein